MTPKRLIEVDFPLEQVSLDSVHEKNVRHDNLWRGGRRATLGRHRSGVGRG